MTPAPKSDAPLMRSRSVLDRQQLSDDQRLQQLRTVLDALAAPQVRAAANVSDERCRELRAYVDSFERKIVAEDEEAIERAQTYVELIHEDADNEKAVEFQMEQEGRLTVEHSSYGTSDRTRGKTTTAKSYVQTEIKRLLLEQVSELTLRRAIAKRRGRPTRAEIAALDEVASACAALVARGYAQAHIAQTIGVEEDRISSWLARKR